MPRFLELADVLDVDTRQQVERKIGIKPYYASDPNVIIPHPPYDDGRSYWEKYELDGNRFVFIFTSFEEPLSLLGVHLLGEKPVRKETAVQVSA